PISTYVTPRVANASRTPSSCFRRQTRPSPSSTFACRRSAPVKHFARRSSSSEHSPQCSTPLHASTRTDYRMTKDTEDADAAVQQDYHVKLELSEYQQELERRRLADANERAQFDRTQRALHEGKVHRRTKELVDALALPTFDLP